MTDTKTRYWHPGLQCELITLHCHFERKLVLLYFPENNCCDMNGAIALARTVFADVELVRTFSNEVPDTFYAKRDGRWTAHRA